MRRDASSRPVQFTPSREPCERLITIYRYVKEPGKSPIHSMTQPRHSFHCARDIVLIYASPWAHDHNLDHIRFFRV
jgi:hypothetical protein